MSMHKLNQFTESRASRLPTATEAVEETTPGQSLCTQKVDLPDAYWRGRLASAKWPMVRVIAPSERAFSTQMLPMGSSESPRLFQHMLAPVVAAIQKSMALRRPGCLNERPLSGLQGAWRGVVQLVAIEPCAPTVDVARRDAVAVEDVANVGADDHLAQHAARRADGVHDSAGRQVGGVQEGGAGDGAGACGDAGRGSASALGDVACAVCVRRSKPRTT